MEAAVKMAVSPVFANDGVEEAVVHWKRCGHAQRDTLAGKDTA